MIRFTQLNLWIALWHKDKSTQATAMSGEDQHYRIGDRVRLSELGKQRMTRSRTFTAKVVGFGRSETTIRVVFDGSSYPVSLHASYIEKDGEQPAGITSRD